VVIKKAAVLVLLIGLWGCQKEDDKIRQALKDVFTRAVQFYDAAKQKIREVERREQERREQEKELLEPAGPTSLIS
jgi:hypothetical protein